MPCNDYPPTDAEYCKQYSKMTVEELKTTRYPWSKRAQNEDESAYIWYRNHLMDDLRRIKKELEFTTSELDRMIGEEGAI